MGQGVGSPVWDRAKVEVTESTGLITGVSKPTRKIHSPPADHDTGTAVVICPGGGYWDLYWLLEGEEVATGLNSICWGCISRKRMCGGSAM